MNSEILVHLGSRSKINPENISFLKADINYTRVFLDDGSSILSSVTLGVLEKRLKGFDFFRLNRSYIVNKNYISIFEEEACKIIIKNDDVIAISRRRSKAFINYYQSNQ